MDGIAQEALDQHRHNRVTQIDQLANLMKLLRILDAASLFAEGVYANLATSGHFLQGLFQAYRSGHPEVVAECMFGYLRFVPDARAKGQSDASIRGHRILTQLLQNPNTISGSLERFTTLVKETQQIDVVFEVASVQEPVPPFVVTVLRTLLDDEDVSKPYELVRNNWSVIQKVLENSGESRIFELFHKKLPGFNDLVVNVAQGEFDDRESGLYVALVRSNAGSDFADWCANGLPSVDKGTWSEGFASNGDIVRLVN